jgi:hypothetical protein
MSQELQKLAGDLQGVLSTTSQHLRKMANAQAELLATNKQQDHELKAYKLARRMEQRGLASELDYEQKVAKLLETPIEKLATMEQAVELATGGFRLGSVQTDDKTAADDELGGTPGPDVLDSFITSQAAYT